MGAINQPANKNFLSQLGFRFVLARMPSVSFFLTDASLPGISLSPANVPSPFKVMPFAPDKIEYNELPITFKVDENLTNYLEVYKWMVGLGFPTSFEERKELVAKDGIFSDGTLTILNSAMNKTINIKFENLIPVSLSDLNFTTTSVDVEYIPATVQFRYQRYTIDIA